MSPGSRPAKRQRRQTTASSDEDTSDETPALQQTRGSSTLHGTQNHRANNPILTLPSQSPKRKFQAVITTKPTNSSPKSSPEKPRKHSKIKKQDDVKTKSLHSFFGKATEQQRWHRKSATPEVDVRTPVLSDDIIDDDDSLDEVFKTEADALEAEERSSTSHKSSVLESSSATSKHASQTTSRRFVKAPILAKTVLRQVTTAQGDESELSHQPWADRYHPDTIDELAIHKKKIADVQRWVNEAYESKAGHLQKRLLVLKGPAGCGKTSTISLLARSQHLIVVPWQNPVVSESGLLSATLQFGEFLSRGGDYGALSLNDSIPQSASVTGTQKRLLLVEEFPTTITQSSNALDSFRSTILHYLASCGEHGMFGTRQSSVETHPPVVFVISETLISSSTALRDSFTAHRLLGPELSSHPLVSIIEFNPVAPTLIAKALELVVKKEARDSKRRRTPGPAVLQKLAEVGDVRSAINSLEFLCARGDENADWSGTVAAASKKSSKNSTPLTEMEKNTLQFISQRETTLDMFHAAGKVVYNKREDPRVLDTRAAPPPKPPDHLMHLYPPKVSQVDVEALLNETGTDIQTFISTVHENYILSCNSDDFVDYFENCSYHLSDSDVLNPDSRSVLPTKGSAQRITTNFQSGLSETLRQDEISFQVATRGLLFSLPFPVNRATPPSGRKSDSYKMFYPASLRLWRPTEEIHDLISLYASRLSSNQLSDSFRHLQPRDGGVASWKHRVDRFSSVSHSFDPNDSDEEATAPRCDTSHDTLVLETLPYLSMIRSSQDATSILSRITQLHGLNISTDDPFDEVLDPTTQPKQTALSTRLSQKVEAAHNSLRKHGTKSSSTDPTTTTGSNTARSDSDPTMEKLYIEDDDIID